MTLRSLSPLEKKARANRLNAERRELGLCTWCGARSEPGRSQCRVHLDAVAKRERDRRDREKERSEQFIRRVRV